MTTDNKTTECQSSVCEILVQTSRPRSVVFFVNGHTGSVGRDGCWDVCLEGRSTFRMSGRGKIRCFLVVYQCIMKVIII